MYVGVRWLTEGRRQSRSDDVRSASLSESWPVRRRWPVVGRAAKRSRSRS